MVAAAREEARGLAKLEIIAADQIRLNYNNRNCSNSLFAADGDGQLVGMEKERFEVKR